MKETIIAFDIDGTLLNNQGIPPETPTYLRPRCGVNLEVVMLMQILAKKMKNTKVIVWSGGGEEYAQKICREYGFDKYIHGAYGKHEYDDTIHGKVDICFDDVHACELASMNLIVKMK
jgi:phosphoserine phosphatase